MANPKFSEKIIRRFNQNQFFLEMEKLKTRKELFSVCKVRGIDIDLNKKGHLQYLRWKISKKKLLETYPVIDSLVCGRCHKEFSLDRFQLKKKINLFVL